jgi:predicted nucleotidyltransferase
VAIWQKKKLCLNKKILCKEAMSDFGLIRNQVLRIVKPMINSSHCICIRGSIARGDVTKYSDVDLVLLQKKCDIEEYIKLNKYLKCKFNKKISLIKFSIDDFKSSIDLLFLVSVNNMIFFTGNAILFNRFKLLHNNLVSDISYNKLYKILKNDIFSVKDKGQYYNLKNGSFSILKLEFSDLLNKKKKGVFPNKKYKSKLYNIRNHINKKYKDNVESSRNFERLNNLDSFDEMLFVLQLKIIRICYILHFNFIKYKLIINNL